MYIVQEKVKFAKKLFTMVIFDKNETHCASMKATWLTCGQTERPMEQHFNLEKIFCLCYKKNINDKNIKFPHVLSMEIS